MERSLLLKTRAKNLVLAVVASALGDGLIPTAFAIQSFKLDSSGRLLTFVLIALWSAKLISSLALDKIPTPVFPARIMVLSDFGRALAQVGLLVYLLLFANFWGPALIISSFLYGFFAPWFGPNRFSLLASILTGEERRKINSLLSAIGDALFLAGPLLGSALTLGLGFKAVLVIDTFTFVISMAFIASYWNVRSKSGQQEAPEEKNRRAVSRKSRHPAYQASPVGCSRTSYLAYRSHNDWLYRFRGTHLSDGPVLRIYLGMDRIHRRGRLPLGFFIIVFSHVEKGALESPSDSLMRRLCRTSFSTVFIVQHLRYCYRHLAARCIDCNLRNYLGCLGARTAFR